MAQRRSRGLKKRPARSAYWRGQIEGWLTSGLTQAEFCRQHELSLTAFRWWRWKLKKEDGESRPSTVPLKSSEGMRLVPVRVLDSEVQSPASLCASASSDRLSAFEVLLQSGTCIRVPGNFDAEALRRLLHTLEAVGC